MLFCGIDLLDEQFHLQKNRFVGVRNGRIDYIGKTKPTEAYDREYNGANRLLMTGAFNAHSHAPMTLLRGYAENLPLSEWLNSRVFPFEAKLRPNDIYNGTMLAIAEMLRFGTVSFSDMYYMGEEVARAVLETGIKCNFSRGVTCFDNSEYLDLKAYNEAQRLISLFHNAGEERLKIDLSIHGEYTSTPSVVAALAEHALEQQVHVHIHLSETLEEHEACKSRHGKTPARYFYDLRVFENPTTAAHCVWLEDEDMDIFLENGVTVAACPVSNMKLASGFARVDKMLAKGLRVALGTDSAASNNNLNIFKDVHAFAIVYKASSGNPAAITPAQALHAITAAGARSQGREDCGVLKVGAKADLIVFDTAVPHMIPAHDVLNNLVFAAQGSDIRLTMVDGEVLYENGEYKTLDIEKVLFEAQQSTRDILERV